LEIRVNGTAVDPAIPVRLEPGVARLVVKAETAPVGIEWIEVSELKI
jgi:hypothetical protein